MVNMSCTEDILRLSTSRVSLTNRSIFVGIISLGLGAAYYGAESYFLKIVYILGCFVIGATFLEDWETCVFDRNSQTVTLSRKNIFRMLLVSKKPRDHIVVNLQSVMSVRVEPRCKTKDQVVLLLTSGMRLSVLDSGNDTINLSKNECNALVEKIRRFLKLDQVEIVESDDYDRCSYYSDGETSSTDAETELVTNYGLPRERITLISERR